MEVIALLYFAIIPGCIIGFFVGFFWLFRKLNIGGRLLVSVVFGLALGYFSPCIISIPFQIRSTTEQRNKDRVALDEATYFRNALAGKYSDKELIEHYKASPLSYLGENKISQSLYDATQSNNRTSKLLFITEIQPKALPVLITTFESKPRIVGYLVALPETPVNLKDRIADSKYPDAVRYLASDEKTPPDILAKLATHPSKDIARIVHDNKNAPQKARYIYSIRGPFFEDWPPRDEVFCPPGLDWEGGEKVWRDLCSDTRDYVRTWVARSQAAPPEILALLANDRNKEILQWVVLNNNSTPKTKRQAARNLSKTVSGLITELSESDDQHIREAVVLSKDTPKKILQFLCDDENENVRRALAESSRVTPDMLEVLADNSSHYVLAAVAKNPKTPIPVLKKLLNTSVSFYKIPEVAAENLRQRGQLR